MSASRSRFWQYSGDDIVDDFDLDRNIVDFSQFGPKIDREDLREKITEVIPTAPG